MKAPEAISALSALASAARLAVFRLLVKRGPEGYTPSELTKRLDLPAPTLSFHLKGLVQAGLVVSRRDGRNLYYSPNFERMNALVGFLTENCCSLAGADCGADCEPLAAAAAHQGREHEASACPCSGEGSRHIDSFLFPAICAEPSVRKHDYAKWMLEDPRVNFAISQRSNRG